MVVASISSVDVAQYIYDSLGSVDGWKLQKLAYYAQAWNLAWTGAPLFDDKIVAFRDGPVAWDLYRENTHNRRGTQLPGADSSRLKPGDRATVDAVLEHYGSMTSDQLIDLTHCEGPWRTARGELGERDHGRNPISLTMMRDFYSKSAMNGDRAPVRKMGQVNGAVDALQAAATGMRQIRRWSETLDWLAAR